MRSIPAFSKKSGGGAPCVSGGGQRSGFTQHVKSTNAGKPKSPPHMAGGTRHLPSANYPGPGAGGKTGAKGNMKVPSFKSHSGAAAKSVPAFSKSRSSGRKTPST